MTPEALQKGDEIYKKIKEIQEALDEENNTAGSKACYLEDISLKYVWPNNNNYSLAYTFALRSDQLKIIRDLVFLFAKKNIEELKAELTAL